MARKSPLTAVFKALSNAGRRKVFQIICRGGRRRREGITVDQICRGARMKQPVVSHHVARLSEAGLIERTKRRWWVFCRPRREGMAALRRFLRDPGTAPIG